MRNRYQGLKTQPHGPVVAVSNLPAGCLGSSHCSDCLAFCYCQSDNPHIDIADWYLLPQTQLFNLIKSKNHE